MKNPPLAMQQIQLGSRCQVQPGRWRDSPGLPPPRTKSGGDGGSEVTAGTGRVEAAPFYN